MADLVNAFRGLGSRVSGLGLRALLCVHEEAKSIQRGSGWQTFERSQCQTCPQHHVLGVRRGRPETEIATAHPCGKVL